jgi:U6 snRNA phosphodiesterase
MASITNLIALAHCIDLLYYFFPSSLLEKFRSMCETLNKSLRDIRQTAFYDNPRFHASIAWALLERACAHTKPPTLNHVETKELQQQPSAASGVGSGSSDLTTRGVLPQAAKVNNDDDNEPFPSVAAIPASLAASLNSKFEIRMASPHVGSFEVEKLSIKIGKDVFSWNLVQ